MIIVGLTGSIGMGKSTTAQMFRDEGIPVNDADAVVHDLYRNEAVGPIEEAFPGTAADGQVDRQALSAALAKDPQGFKTLERIVHPLVRQREKAFLKAQEEAGAFMTVLDIPLLFETGGNERVDLVVVVSCDEDIQRERVLSRPGMTEEKFLMIKSRQTPDSEKRKRADFVIDTGHGLENARQAVKRIIAEIRARNGY